MYSFFRLFTGSSHPVLAEKVASILGVGVGKMQIDSFPDGEIGVQVVDSVRGADVFVFQSPSRDPNYYLMELLIIVDALKRASARSIVAVLPYYPYARQDRKDRGRVPITARLVANLMETAGVTRLLTMDLHTDQIQGFFNIPVDNLRGRSLLVSEIRRLNLESPVIVSPDVGSNRMAQKFAEDLGIDFAIVDKRRVGSRDVICNALIGDVRGRQVVLVDDMCSTGRTLELAAKVCGAAGASVVHAAVTHGLFVEGGGLPSGIDSFIATDSVPLSLGLKDKVSVASIASYVANAIDCIVAAKSISSLSSEKKSLVNMDAGR